MRKIHPSHPPRRNSSTLLLNSGGQGNPTRLTAANVKVIHLDEMHPIFFPTPKTKEIQAAWLQLMQKSSTMMKAIHRYVMHPLFFPTPKAREIQAAWLQLMQKSFHRDDIHPLFLSTPEARETQAAWLPRIRKSSTVMMFIHSSSQLPRPGRSKPLDCS